MRLTPFESRAAPGPMRTSRSYITHQGMPTDNRKLSVQYSLSMQFVREVRLEFAKFMTYRFQLSHAPYNVHFYCPVGFEKFDVLVGEAKYYKAVGPSGGRARP